mmetsp:Transcript_70690/g.133423  ORF Transcript_70690/g.133423 Transcript_70690/m.133423 type:complete len:149 (+) Transcript_70690:175-621(+)
MKIAQTMSMRKLSCELCLKTIRICVGKLVSDYMIVFYNPAFARQALLKNTWALLTLPFLMLHEPIGALHKWSFQHAVASVMISIALSNLYVRLSLSHLLPLDRRKLPYQWMLATQALSPHPPPSAVETGSTREHSTSADLHHCELCSQ